MGGRGGAGRGGVRAGPQRAGAGSRENPRRGGRTRRRAFDPGGGIRRRYFRAQGAGPGRRLWGLGLSSRVLHSFRAVGVALSRWSKLPPSQRGCSREGLRWWAGWLRLSPGAPPTHPNGRGQQSVYPCVPRGALELQTRTGGPEKSGADGIRLTPFFSLGPHPNPRGGGEMNPSTHAGALGGPGGLVKFAPAPRGRTLLALGIRGKGINSWNEFHYVGFGSERRLQSTL